MIVGSRPVAVTYTSDNAAVSSKEVLDIQATIEYGFTLKRVRDMTKTYVQPKKYFRPNKKHFAQFSRKDKLILS